MAEKKKYLTYNNCHLNKFIFIGKIKITIHNMHEDIRLFVLAKNFLMFVLKNKIITDK